MIQNMIAYAMLHADANTTQGRSRISLNHHKIWSYLSHGTLLTPRVIGGTTLLIIAEMGPIHCLHLCGLRLLPKAVTITANQITRGFIKQPSSLVVKLLFHFLNCTYVVVTFIELSTFEFLFVFFVLQIGIILLNEVNKMNDIVDNQRIQGAKVVWFESFDIKLDRCAAFYQNKSYLESGRRSGTLSPSASLFIVLQVGIWIHVINLMSHRIKLPMIKLQRCT